MPSLCSHRYEYIFTDAKQDERKADAKDPYAALLNNKRKVFADRKTAALQHSRTYMDSHLLFEHG